MLGLKIYSFGVLGLFEKKWDLHLTKGLGFQVRFKKI